MVEKRKFIRLKTPVKIVYTLIKKQKKQKAISSVTRDISAGGLRIVAKEPLRSGELIELEMFIPYLEESIKAVGEVVWCSGSREHPSETHEAGIRFRDIASRDLHCVLEYVHAIGIG